MILNLIICFCLGWLAPIFWVNLTVMYTNFSVFSPKSINRLAPIDPIFTYELAGKKIRRSQFFADSVILLASASITAGLIYWSVSRGVQWSYLVAIVGFFPGAATAMGIYRDEMEKTHKLLRAFPGFKDTVTKGQGTRSLPEGIEDAVKMLLYDGGVMLILDDVLAAISEKSPEIQQHLDSRKLTPETMARQFCTNVAGNQLESGNHHLYRGVLTPTGERLMAFYEDAWHQEDRSESDIDEEIQYMRRAIREVG
jgi:hypothetical protein